MSTQTAEINGTPIAVVARELPPVVNQPAPPPAPAANKNAVAATAVISKRMLREEEMILVRLLGYTPCLLNGQEIGKVRIDA